MERIGLMYCSECEAFHPIFDELDGEVSIDESITIWPPNNGTSIGAE